MERAGMAKPPKKNVPERKTAERNRPHQSPEKQPIEEIPVAGGGLLDRRLVLKGGALFSAAALGGSASALAGENKTPSPPLKSMPPETPPWMKEPGAPFTNYGQPSPHEKSVIRWISANQDVPGNGVSWTPLHDLGGTITPNGLHFERHHNGVPQIDPDAHRLMIHGLVSRPLIFTVDDLLRYPMVSKLCFLECGGNSNAGWNPEPLQARAGHMHGLVSCSEWMGVPLSTLLDEAGVDRAQGKWILAEGADAVAVSASIPLDKAMDDVIVALYQNGERIRPGNGYPLRLILPGWEGILAVKWLRRIEVAARPAMTRDETSKYTELQPSGSARQFTFVMEPKSVILAPSPGMTLPSAGLYEISGLAWSGNGRVHRVDVSADGGKSWTPAALSEPVLPHCFTRFRLPWKWNGGPNVLQSRTTDELGMVQPTRSALVGERGLNGYFHYNAIVSWEVDEFGDVSHVYV